MERARATWTDERLDDLARRVDDGFNRVDAQLLDLSRHIDVVETRLGSRLDALQRTILHIGGGVIVTVLATLVSVIATRG